MTLAALLLGWSSTGWAACDSRLEEADLQTINQARDQGGLGSEEPVRSCLARIQAYEPKLNAMIRVNPRALARARVGLPVGLSFFRLPYSEPTLIGLAYAFEQHTSARKMPATVPPLASP